MDIITNCGDIDVTSEELADFIINLSIPSQETIDAYKGICYQLIAPFYSAVYSPLSETADMINNGAYSYISVPKLYAISDDIRTGFDNFDALPSALDITGISAVREQPALQLTGEGVIIGIIDTGIDYTSPAFMFNNGETRILGIWDQTDNGGRHSAYLTYGSEYTKEDINRALKDGSVLGTSDDMGHGTALMKISAGNIVNAAPGESLTGAAPRASIIAVKLRGAKQYLRKYYGIKEGADAYQENHMMQAVAYLKGEALRFGMPIVIYSALTTNMGGHDGTLPFDDVFARYGNMPGTCVVTGTGNEANKSHHFEGNLKDLGKNEYLEAEVRISGDNTIYMEVWTTAPDIISMGVVSPTGDIIEKIPTRTNGVYHYRLTLDGTAVTIENISVGMKNYSQLIRVRMVKPKNGIWTFRFYKENSVNGVFNAWLLNSEFIDEGTYFLRPQPDVTLNSSSCRDGVIAVATYEIDTGGIYPPSGRGFTRGGQRKPDFVSPRVNLTGTGSSVAITAGACAQYLEWSRGNEEPGGQKSGVATTDVVTTDVNIFLIRGAKRERDNTYPSKIYGFGKLNIYDAFSVS